MVEPEVIVNLLNKLKMYLLKWKMEGDTVYLWFASNQVDSDVIPKILETIMDTNPDECSIDSTKQEALRLWWD